MRRILKFCIIFLVVVVLVALAAPFFIPVGALKNTVIAQLQAATGRTVSLDKLSLSLFPDIALSATDVKIGNAPWAGAGDMADIKTLRLGVALLPLLHKEVSVKELTLEEPLLNLVKKGDQANWQFGKPQTQAPISTKPAAAAANPAASLGGVSLGKITIKDGSLSFSDLAAHTTQSLAHVNLSLEAPDPSEKATFDANAVLNGTKLQLALGISKPMGLTSGGASDISFKSSYGPVDVSWQGTLALAGGVPNFTGKVTIPKIDTDELKSLSKQQENASGASAMTAKAAPAPVPAGHWSNDPIDLNALKSAEAMVTVEIGKLVLPKTTLDNIVVNIHLQKGVLSVTTNDISAYSGTAKLAVSATSANAATVAVVLDNVKAEPLLHDFAGYDRLSGTLAGHVNLNTAGGSERAMVSALAGTGDFHFKDGSLKGINLAAMARNVGTAFQGGNNESTDFSELSGTFTVKNGVASNSDLQMNSPLLRVGGEGNADLPGWHVNYLLKPKLVASLQGQGGSSASGITVPIRVEGALDNPGYKPDLQAALSENLANPAAVKDTVKGLKQNLLSGNPASGLGGLLR